MTNLPLATSPNYKLQTDRLSWGVVELQVTDLKRAANFWMSALGLIKRNSAATSISLGTNKKTLFVLHTGASKAAEPAYTGMYHVAIGVRSQVEFSRLLARLIQLKVRVSPTDHLLAKSLYLIDPDGLEIEIYFETPERFGHFGDVSRGLSMYDSEGRPHNGREPLNVHAELAHTTSANVNADIADDAYIAHIHFKVGNIEPALDWFETLGFSRHLTLTNWGFADMGAGVANTHRLAMNIWAGQNLPAAPNDMARLIRYELIGHDAGLLTNAPLKRDGNILRGCDPTGVDISLRLADSKVD
ncbi:VOC family protein [Ahrensia kielensis]|uniref:VOC family protein n=1 Tax=Ahrensia kielensis TaxID=76980 RepID=UPI000378A319|nr:VOC family protein [Ahrensia kielensis]